MTTLLASLFLAVATTQHAPAAAEHDAAAPAHEVAAAAESSEHAQPAAEAAGHGEEHAAAGHAEAAGHGEGEGEGEEKASLSDVMLGHVSDGYVLEFPWVCNGGFNFECEVNLKHVFGDSLVFGSVDMTPTKHLIMMWLASVVLLLVVLGAVKKRNLVPHGLYNFIEVLAAFVRIEIARANIGEKHGDRYVPYLMSVFFFILFVNLFGLVPWAATATGNIAVTAALSAFTFILTQFAAIKAMGLVGWLKHLTGGVAVWLWPIMVPVEILGLFTKPFALTVRLFANMIAGHIVILSLLGLIFAIGSPFVALGSVPLALAIFGLEIFVAFVQAYIFAMLSSLFIGQGIQHGEHAHAHAEHGDGGHGDHGSHVAGHSPGHG
jgi:F-type H+-transporting ATPase subunit a